MQEKDEKNLQIRFRIFCPNKWNILPISNEGKNLQNHTLCPEVRGRGHMCLYGHLYTSTFGKWELGQPATLHDIYVVDSLSRKTLLCSVCIFYTSTTISGQCPKEYFKNI